MEFERYNAERHSDKVVDWFSGKASPPEEDFGEYRRVVEDAYMDFKDVFGLDRSVDFVLAETDVSVLEERYDEVPDWAYGQGFSSDPEWHDVDSPTVFVMVNNEYEFWEDLLKYVSSHELSHQKFYENHEVGWNIYQRMMLEGHAMLSAEKISQEKNLNWSNQDWKPGKKIDKKQLLNELDKKTTWMEENPEETSTLFVPGGEKWQKAEGYPITFQITQNILNKTKKDINKLLEMNFEQWRQETEKSIESIY